MSRTSAFLSVFLSCNMPRKKRVVISPEERERKKRHEWAEIINLYLHNKYSIRRAFGRCELLEENSRAPSSLHYYVVSYEGTDIGTAYEMVSMVSGSIPWNNWQLSLPTQCNGVNGAFCKAHDTPLPPDVQMNEETRRTLYDWFYGGHPKMSESMIRSLPRPPPGPPMMRPKDYCYLAPRKHPVARQPRQSEQTQTAVATMSRVTFMPSGLARRAYCTTDSSDACRGIIRIPAREGMFLCLQHMLVTEDINIS